MLKPTFSSVACPDWPLERVAASAREFGFQGVELRTFGPRTTLLACDPFLTAPQKTASLFEERGVEIASLGTSARFDDPISPPVLGMAIGDTERPVRAAKRCIDLAARLGCPLVRVFAFELPPREKRQRAIGRITQRLEAVLDHARNTGVRVVLENGGSFPTASDLAELLDRVRHPLLGASYSVAVSHAAGESVERGIGSLGDRLWMARVKDLCAGRPGRLGDGDVPCEPFVRALVGAGFNGPLVYEWDRLWVPGLADAQSILPQAAATLYRWIGDALARVSPGGGRAVAV